MQTHIKHFFKAMAVIITVIPYLIITVTIAVLYFILSILIIETYE
jgi:hypothetical protein